MISDRINAKSKTRLVLACLQVLEKKGGASEVDCSADLCDCKPELSYECGMS